MSTVEEIESAIETLPLKQVEKLSSWLEDRKAKLADKASSHSNLIGMWKDRIVLKPGWDDPLEDFKEYME